MRGLSRWGYAGLALLLLHLVLLLFPPIPPIIKGSLWSYLLGYVAILLLLVELAGSRARLVAVWSGRPGVRRWAVGLGLTAGVLLLAVALRSVVPVTLERFTREEGLFEPLTLFCYLGGAIVVARLVSEAEGRPRRHWRFVCALFLLLALEEIDYFGIFGGLIGRVEGVYVGSLHDLVLLMANGSLGPTAGMAIGAGLGVGLAFLGLTGHLQPRALWRMVVSGSFAWVIVGLLLLAVSAATEAAALSWAAGPPTLEEALELAGAVPFFCYALELTARWTGRAPS